MPSISHAVLLTRLRTLGADIREHVDRIDHGGCGVLAGNVAGAVSRLGFQSEVVTPSGGRAYGYTPNIVRARMLERDIDPAAAMAHDWDDYGLQRSHLAMRFISEGRAYTWDHMGLVRTGRRFGRLSAQAAEYRGARYWCDAEYEFGHGLTPNETLAMVRDTCARQWNSTFDRTQIPRVISLVHKHILGEESNHAY